MGSAQGAAVYFRDVDLGCSGSGEARLDGRAK